ncbi:MAG: hypothetical protein PUJ57_02990 [Peptoniphilaceae bacterium]|nr:hypothetical protein [Peptoniphilaceae bacterium]MDY6085408.1 hypothetical protein [Peptoniphilaceae bacterium]
MQPIKVYLSLLRRSGAQRAAAKIDGHIYVLDEPAEKRYRIVAVAHLVVAIVLSFLLLFLFPQVLSVPGHAIVDYLLKLVFFVMVYFALAPACSRFLLMPIEDHLMEPSGARANDKRPKGRRKKNKYRKQ